MASEEQLAILKQGVDVWNQWREKNSETEIDLAGADFHEQDLSKINLSSAHLDLADFVAANLTEANLYRAHLSGAAFNFATLYQANFQEAYLDFSDIRNANLCEANLNHANLKEADLRESNLTGASLLGAYLEDTNFIRATLNAVDFTSGVFAYSIFDENDLSTTFGLETGVHELPSHIGNNTIQKSKGKIPIAFLRGCGLSDVDIEYAKLANPDLTAHEISEITERIFDLKETQAIQISKLFISYSHANSDFADRLEEKLNKDGIRFWRDIHDATAGRLEKQIDRAIRQNPTVLLVLSEHSTNSDWVEHEARLARKLEKELGRDVLCPIALDDSWKSCNWPERIKEQIMEYNILDFSNWEDDGKFDKMFKKLIDGLDMFYKK